MAGNLKMVRALRQGSYDGHRRRAGAVFPVKAGAKEDWFEDVGAAPEGTELPAQIQNAQAPRGKPFTAVMQELADKSAQPSQNVGDQQPITLAEAAATVAVPEAEQVV